MKLYFYILDTDYITNESNLRFEECEVHEKPKTYYPSLDGFPEGVNRAYISKDDVGHISGYSNNIVILDEPSAEMAKKLFSDQMEKRIERAKSMMDDYEKRLSAVRSFVG